MDALIENPLIANDHDLVAGLVIEEPHDFRVSARVYTSPALFELEMDRIFGTTWVSWCTKAKSPTQARSSPAKSYA
jgi:hypothetical protein